MDDRIFTVPEDSGDRLDTYLSGHVEGLTRSAAKVRLERGDVTVNGEVKPPKYKPRRGDVIAISLEQEQRPDLTPQNIPLDIVYEDESMAVVNKPKGMVVHPAAGNPDGTLVNALLYHIRDLSGINGELRPGIVHRLDKDTTGLLVIAKNDQAHVVLAKQIQEKTAARIYDALVYGRMGEGSGTIDLPIGRHRTDRKRMAVVPGGRRAITHYEVVRVFERYTLLKLKLGTGRTHQIRVHLSHTGHPVVGDEVYCKIKPPFATQGQMLHAGELSLNHPVTGERMTFRASLPQYFADILAKLR